MAWQQSAVYFHVTEIIADAEEATTTHLFVFHIIPSVVINANIFYFFYQVPCTYPPSCPSQTRRRLPPCLRSPDLFVFDPAFPLLVDILGGTKGPWDPERVG